MSYMAPCTSNDLTGEHIPRVKGTHTATDNITCTCTQEHTRKGKSAECLATVAYGNPPNTLHSVSTRMYAIHMGAQYIPRGGRCTL